MDAPAKAMSLPIRKIPVAFDPDPYTFCRVQNYQQLRGAQKAKSWGVYLWCIEYHEEYLVNYVGKTWDKNGGFWARNRSQLRYWSDGHCECVDVDAFKRGKRIVVPCSPDQLKRELDEIKPLYRVFLTVLEKREILSVENEIAYRLQKNHATSQFLCNKAPYPHDPAVEILPHGTPRIIGVTVPIPQSLQLGTCVGDA